LILTRINRGFLRYYRTLPRMIHQPLVLHKTPPSYAENRQGNRFCLRSDGITTFSPTFAL